MASVSISAPNAVVEFGDTKQHYAYDVLRICIERNQRYSADLVHKYIQWEATKDLPNCSLYKKVRYFLQTRALPQTIPIFAKTMTGELIPLEYRPYCDKRHLLEQLEEIDSDLYSFGSTNIVRLVEDSTAPVQEGEIFCIIKADTFHAVTFQTYDNEYPYFTPEDGPCVHYFFDVKASFFHNVPFLGDDEEDEDEEEVTIEVSIKHFIDQQVIMINDSVNKYPLDHLHEEVGGIHIVHNGMRYDLNEQAQQELVALFQIVCRDM